MPATLDRRATDPKEPLIARPGSGFWHFRRLKHAQMKHKLAGRLLEWRIEIFPSSLLSRYTYVRTCWASSLSTVNGWRAAPGSSISDYEPL